MLKETLTIYIVMIISTDYYTWTDIVEIYQDKQFAEFIAERLNFYVDKRNSDHDYFEVQEHEVYKNE